MPAITHPSGTRRAAAVLAACLLTAGGSLAFAKDIKGTDGNDTVRANACVTGVCANDPNISLSGTVLDGGPGRDVVTGGGGGEIIRGGTGADVLRGGPGNDRLTGGAGRDRIYGGPGNDRVYARDRLRDLVSCGSGRDRATVDRRDRVRGCEVVKRAG